MSNPDVDARPSAKLIVGGISVFLSPVWMTIAGLGLCALVPTDTCLVVPFLWMALWPSFLIGLALILLGVAVAPPRANADIAEAIPTERRPLRFGEWFPVVVLLPIAVALFYMFFKNSL